LLFDGLRFDGLPLDGLRFDGLPLDVSLLDISLEAFQGRSLGEVVAVADAGAGALEDGRDSSLGGAVDWLLSGS
jgi:hypothetical protein